MEYAVNQKHIDNLEKIDAIYEAIDRYLSYMKDSWAFRKDSNRAPAIIKWKEQFIDLRSELVTSYEGVIQNIFHLNLVRSESKGTHSTGIEDLTKILPLIHNQNTSVLSSSNHPQDSIIDLIGHQTEIGREEINKLIPQVNYSFNNYTKCVGMIEKAKTSNYEPMGLSEQLLLKDNNLLGRELANYVLKIKFETLNFFDFQELLLVKN